MADAVDKMALVAVAFGFGDPTGVTLTIASAMSLSAKTVGAISIALSEIAKKSAGPANRDQRTALILFIANEAYFEALEEILTPRLPDIGQAKISCVDGSSLEAMLADDDSAALLQGRCSLFTAYEAQLKAALRNAGLIWTERERLAERVSERAQSRLGGLLAKSIEPYATLRNRLNNETTAAIAEAVSGMPKKVADEFERRGATSTHPTSGPVGLSVPPIVVDVIAPVASGVQALGEQLARIEQHLLSTVHVQVSAAAEVSVQLRINKEMFDRAKILLETGKLGAAASLFEAVVGDLLTVKTEEAVNLRARAMANMGHCHHRQGRNADAISLFREAHALAPANIRIRINAAMADLLEQKLETAELALRRLFEEFPDENDVLELLAEALSRRGLHAEALALLEASTRASESYLCSVSDLQLKVGRNGDAEKTARDAVSRFPCSHYAMFALSLVIMVPILNRDNAIGLISAKERGRLREAAFLLEAAVTTARKEEQHARLGIYLVNLCAVRSAIGEHDAAVVAGLEAKRIVNEDVVLLQNLFIAQLMLERYDDAAATAREIGAREPGPDAVSRQMHALIGASRYGQALAAFDLAAKETGVDSDPRLLALRIECFRKLPDLDAAERELAEAYNRIGRCTELLMQEALMRSVADQNELADRLFSEAENVAQGREQVVARRRYGLYLYRRRRWAEAVTRLVHGDEDPVASVVAVEHLHCLFELNRMPQVVEIGLAIISVGVFRAPIWEITAQALAVLGRVRDAEKLFRELVQHEPTEKQHLALASICYRARGLNAAVKVLEAAQVQHPKSYYVKVNLSGLYFSRREYRKAFDAAKRAIEISPKRHEGHTAMVRILGAGDGLTLSEAEKVLLQRSVTQSKSVRQLQMKTVGDDIDLSEIIKILKDQSDYVQQVMQVYRENKLPVTMLAQILGRPLIDVWTGITRSMIERLVVGSGTYEEQEAEHKLAVSAPDVMLDASALLTLQSLGLLQNLSQRFSKVHVATATFEKFSEELTNLSAFAVSTSSMGYQEGRIHITDVGPEFHIQKLTILEDVLAFLESDAVILDGLDSKSWADRKEGGKPGLDAWIMHPVIIAKANGCALYSDEYNIRSLAKQSYGVVGFSTQALLRALVDLRIIDNAKYSQGVVQLVGMNFDFVSLALDDILRHLKESNYTRTELFTKLIRQLQASSYTNRKSSWILGGLIGHLWLERSNEPADRAEWIGLCLDSLNLAKEPNSVMLEVLAAAGIQLANLPEAFTALMHFITESPRLKSEHRSLVRETFLVILTSLAQSIAVQSHPVIERRWAKMIDWLHYKERVFGANSQNRAKDVMP